MRFTNPRSAAAALLFGSCLALAVPAEHAGAQNLLEFLFGGLKQQQRAPAPPSDNPIGNLFNETFGGKEQQTSQRSSGGRGSASFCVRTCDGKFFPILRSASSPEQMCQSFCPAAATKVYFGSVIDDATTASGDRYGDSNTAFAFRKALKADCTCNGRSPAGLAQVDLALDNSLRAGDVVATGNGLVAYTGNRSGTSQDFTPVASYPGLTSEVRGRLGEMKVSPNSNDQTSITPAAANAQASSAIPRSSEPKNRRAVVNADASSSR